MRGMLRLALVGLWAVFTAALIAILKETFWSAFTDWLIKEMGYPAGATMIASLAGIGIPTIVAGGAVYGAYLIGRKERQMIKPPTLQIVFENNDKFVRIGTDGVTRIYLGVYNARTDSKTIAFVNMRVHDGEFTRTIIAETNPYAERTNGDVMLLRPIMLDAGAAHYTEIFAYDNSFPPDDDTYWKARHRFTIDARGRDVDVVTAEFELDPTVRPPVLRRVS